MQIRVLARGSFIYFGINERFGTLLCWYEEYKVKKIDITVLLQNLSLTLYTLNHVN